MMCNKIGSPVDGSDWINSDPTAISLTTRRNPISSIPPARTILHKDKSAFRTSAPLTTYLRDRANLSLWVFKCTVFTLSNGSGWSCYGNRFERQKLHGFFANQGRQSIGMKDEVLPWCAIVTENGVDALMVSRNEIGQLLDSNSTYPNLWCLRKDDEVGIRVHSHRWGVRHVNQ